MFIFFHFKNQHSHLLLFPLSFYRFDALGERGMAIIHPNHSGMRSEVAESVGTQFLQARNQRLAMTILRGIGIGTILATPGYAIDNWVENQINR